jgi:FixJ family two-component response regulator
VARIPNVVRETVKSSGKTTVVPPGLPTRSKIYVIDDDPAVRSSLAELFRSARIDAATFPSPQDFLDTTPEEVPSCLVLDLNLEGTNGLDLQERLRREGREIPIIFITGFGDIPATVRAMKAGALDFLQKPFTDDALLSAVHSALARDERARGEHAERAVIQERFEELTPREREVMALVVKGLLNKQIAAELGAAQQTIKIHRGRVMAKMRAQSVPDLVRMSELVQSSVPRST